MVRILFIRHGMTVGNLLSAKMAIRVAKGEVLVQDSHRLGRDEQLALGLSEGEGDTHLSDYKGGGVLEAQMFADYWGPILQSKEDAHEIHWYVSPMERCQQTADPIMQRLQAKATIQPLIMEMPGLCAPTDRVFLDEQVRPLFDSGNGATVAEKMQQRTWTRCGSTADEMKEKYKWVKDLDFSSLGALEAHRINQGVTPWWKGMWERPRETNARIEKAKEWLLGLADTLPKDDVIVLFSHGNTIWRLLSSIVGIDGDRVEHSTANTSVSSVRVNPVSHSSHPRGVQLDFYNRTPHLNERNIAFYKFNGLLKRKVKSGKQKLVDLSDGMRADRINAKAFMSSL